MAAASSSSGSGGARGDAFPSFDIFVRNLMNKTITVCDCNALTTIEEVYDKINMKEGIPIDPAIQKMIFEDRELALDATLDACGIGKEDWLRLALR